MKNMNRMGMLIVVAAIAFAGATVAAEELQPVGAAELFIGQPMPPLPSPNYLGFVVQRGTSPTTNPCSRRAASRTA